MYFKSTHDGLIQVFDSHGSNNYYYIDEIKKAMVHPAAIHHVAHSVSTHHTPNSESLDVSTRIAIEP